MPRKPRVESRSGYYHVMARGNNKKAIFDSELEKVVILKIIKKALVNSGIKLRAYCIMNNHFHLLLDTDMNSKNALTHFMLVVNTKFAGFYNEHHNLVGHVFQDRFRSEAIENEIYLKTVLRYIHQNPVKAGIVKFPSEYKWSSYKGYIHLKEDWVDHELLELFGESKGQRRRMFEAFHKEYEDEVYLEEQEEELAYKIRRAKELMVKLVDPSFGLLTNAEKAEMVVEVSKGAKLPPKNVCDIVGMNYSTWKRTQRK